MKERLLLFEEIMAVFSGVKGASRCFEKKSSDLLYKTIFPGKNKVKRIRSRCSRGRKETICEADQAGDIRITTQSVWKNDGIEHSAMVEKWRRNMEQNKNTETSEKTEKRRKHIYKQKSYLTAGIVTLVAAVAMVGAYQYERKSTQQKQSETAALTENEWTSPKADTPADISPAEDTQETLAAQTPEVSDAVSNPTNDTQASSSDLVQETADTETVAGQTQTVEEPVMHFSASDTITWPLEGNVILNYSMDQSVYFATLDQYRYNPAVIIAGHVNDKVTAASDGQVIGVDTTAETGETVTIGLGDGYQAVYGQLKEVEVSAGDYVSQGDVIGYVAEPTKYYAVEGANLYFAMTKSGKPINPMDYIR